MKRITTLLIFLLATTVASASLDPLDVVIQADPTTKTFVLRSTHPVSELLRMELFDERGVLVYRHEAAPNTFFSKRFPMHSMERGRYVVLLTDSRGRTSLPFTLRLNTVHFDRGEATQTFYPNVRLDEDRLLVVSYPANDGEEVRVELATNTGKTVFTDATHPEQAMTKAYQLNQLRAGTYTFTVTDRHQTLHSERITLR